MYDFLYVRIVSMPVASKTSADGPDNSTDGERKPPQLLLLWLVPLILLLVFGAYCAGRKCLASRWCKSYTAQRSLRRNHHVLGDTSEMSELRGNALDARKQSRSGAIVDAGMFEISDSDDEDIDDSGVCVRFVWHCWCWCCARARVCVFVRTCELYQVGCLKSCCASHTTLH